MDPQSNATIQEKPSALKRAWKSIRNFRETTIILIVVTICIVLTILSPVFMTPDNWRTTLIGMSCSGIVAVGMTICLISGGFDLSVGALQALAAIILGGLHAGGTNIWLSAAVGLGVIACIGLANGYLIGKIKLNALITTLGTMTIARGACYVITSGTPITLGSEDAVFNWLGKGDVLGFPTLVIFLIAVVVIGDFMLRKSKGMRNVFYVGSNEKAASLSGINVSSVRIKVYVISGCLAGLSGVLSASRFGVASPTLGVGLEMSCISAAVIGGASISGGEGTVLGTTLGVILLALISNGLVLMNVSVYWQELISGAVLLTAVLVDHMSNQKKKRLALQKN